MPIVDAVTTIDLRAEYYTAPQPRAENDPACFEISAFAMQASRLKGRQRRVLSY